MLWGQVVSLVLICHLGECLAHNYPISIPYMPDTCEHHVNEPPLKARRVLEPEFQDYDENT